MLDKKKLRRELYYMKEEIIYCYECGIRINSDYEIRDEEDQKQFVCADCYGDYFGLT